MFGPLLKSLSSLDAVVICDAEEDGSIAVGVRQLSWIDLPDLGVNTDIIGSPSFDDVLAVLYSSGTTGRPKGIVMPHAHVYSFGVQWSNATNFQHEDILYAPTPLFYMQATVLGVIPTLMSGAQVHIAERFSASRYWDDIRATKSTIAHGQFSLIPLLLKQPPSPLDNQHDCKRIFIAKSNAEFEERFGVRIIEIYGSTELNMVTYNPWDHPKPGSAGKAAPNFEVKIFDSDDYELPQGEIGEIVARPTEPYVISYGYYHRPEFTLEAWRNTWFHCGDRGYFDEDGYLFFVDRIKDMIRRKGENISSEEVERQVNTHPSVLESAAVPVPAETAEDEVKIYVALKPGTELVPGEFDPYISRGFCLGSWCRGMSSASTPFRRPAASRSRSSNFANWGSTNRRGIERRVRTVAPDTAPSEDGSLSGRVAVVTGAGGVGSAVASTLAARGAEVSVWDIDQAAAQTCAQAIVDQGGSAHVEVVDVRDQSGLDQAAKSVVAQLGGIDVLALCHGVLRTARLLELTEADWDEVVDTNTKGRFLASQVVTRQMIAGGRGGVIVDVGSFTGERIAVGRLHYCAGNAVGESLVRAMAVDLGKYGIRVMSISSGPIDTPLLGDRARDPERMARFLENIPLRRLGEPSDIAEAVAFMVSDDARYWTGGSLAVDGGWMAG